MVKETNYSSKGVSNKGKNLAISTLFVFVLVLLTYFVLANHVVTLSDGSTTTNVNEDVSSFFNVSVNNSDSGQAANITQVNITVPGSFTISNETNGTDTTNFDFSIQNNVLSWSNFTLYLMNGTDVNFFWFNATPSTPGNYNITVATVNSTDTILSNISVSVNDTTVPSVTAINSPANLANATGTIVLNATVTDNGNMDSVYFNVTNTTGDQQSFVEGSNSAGNDWNATLDTTSLTDGDYNITVYANDTANNLNSSEFVQILINNNAPLIDFVSPTAANNSIVASVLNVNVSATDAGAIDTITIRLYNSSNDQVDSSTSSIAPLLANFTGLVDGATYFVNASVNDTEGNSNSTETRTYLFVSSAFEFNGSVNNVNGGKLNNSLVNITIRDMNDFTIVGYSSTNTNASGWFNLSVPSNDQWMYEPKITWTNSSTNAVEFVGQSLPAFPSFIIKEVAGTTFYLREGGTINITAINSTGDRISFRYQIKDQKLGYPIAENFENSETEAVNFLPRDRNYSIMVYPDASMPVSFDWNNFSTGQGYSINSLSTYNFTKKTLHYQFNTTMDLLEVSGFINHSSASGWDEFTVIPYLLEPGNMVHLEFGDLPYNISREVGRSDFYNLSTGFYNITLPSTPAETSNMLLFATARNGSVYYGGFRNISNLGSALTQFNFSAMSTLLGDAGNISMDKLDDGSINISTAKQTFNIVNSTNNIMTNVFVHGEITLDYSDFEAIEFTWMVDKDQGSASTIALPLLNTTGIKEMNVFVGGGNFAPKKKSFTQAQIQTTQNISVSEFNPQDIDGGSASISMSLYTSNSTCDIPTPNSVCVIGGTENEDIDNFNPMKSVIGGGKLSFRMGTGGILVHYVNVDLLASGPPDALFEDTKNETTSGTFESALRFGSQGPTIYDYVLVGVPYTEGSSSVTGLNESAQVNISVPRFYDDDWNTIWSSSSNGTNASALAGNYSHYSDKESEWQTLLSGEVICHENGATAESINSTHPCYIDKSNNTIWIRLPHFSGTGTEVDGTLITADSGDDSSGDEGTSSGTGSAPFWTTYSNSDSELSVLGSVNRDLEEAERVRLKINSEFHYVGVVGLTSTTATINVSSSHPQQEIFSIGEEIQFDVLDDGYYDLAVKLNDITTGNSTVANVTITYVDREIVEDVEENVTTTDTTQNDTTEGKDPVSPEKANSRIREWIWILAILVILSAGISGYYLWLTKHAKDIKSKKGGGKSKKKGNSSNKEDEDNKSEGSGFMSFSSKKKK